MTFETTSPDQQQDDPRRKLRLAGIFILVVAVVAAVSWVTRSSGSTAVTVERSVSRIEIDITAGDVEIVGGGNGPVRYESTTDDGVIRSAQVTHNLTDGTLRLEGDCDGNRFVPAFGCRTDITLTVPDGIAITADVSGGSIEARNLAGPARLESSAGDVRVTMHTGPLNARSTAGHVVVTGLDADEAHVTSSAGAVEIEAVAPPRSLDAESSAGPVSVKLPASAAYDVEARSRTDAVTVDTRTSHSSANKVRAFSSAGPVTVTTTDP